MQAKDVRELKEATEIEQAARGPLRITGAVFSASGLIVIALTVGFWPAVGCFLLAMGQDMVHWWTHHAGWEDPNA